MVHVMSEVIRFDPVGTIEGFEESEFGQYCFASDLDAQRLRADTAEAEVAKLLDKLSYEERDHHTTNLSRDAWRNKYEELLNLIKRAQSFVAFVHKCCRKNKEYAPLHWQEMVELDRDLSATAALNPNPEAESHG